MTKIPTAEEFIKDAQQNPSKGWTARKMLVEFAKLHVKAALKAATANAEADFEPMNWLAEQHCNTPFIQGEDYEIGISRQSILQSYPLENIK